MQAIALPHNDYARSVSHASAEPAFAPSWTNRSDVDRAQDARDAELRKIPYMLVVGDREQESEEVAVREHREGDVGSSAVQAFIERLKREVENRSTS